MTIHLLDLPTGALQAYVDTGRGLEAIESAPVRCGAPLDHDARTTIFSRHVTCSGCVRAQRQASEAA